MVGLDLCPQCFGQTYDDNNQPCGVCLGYGVVYPMFEDDSGKAMAYAFIGPSHRYTREEIDDALTRLRTESPPTANHRLVGILAGMIVLSEDRTEESTEPGEWLQNLLHDADALVIDPSGIFLQHGERGIRIHSFRLT